MAGADGGSNDDVTRGTTTRFVERLEEEIARAGEVGVGSEIDGYMVLESIGTGGNGEVWRVRHPKTGEELALKLIKARAPGAEEMVGFKREWETLRVLKHPNIARLYDCGWWKRAGVAAPYYVMELAQTRNGRRALGVREYARQKKLTAEEKVGLMVGVCRALHHAHEKGVYHRDLKPGNIAVDEMDGAAEDGLGVPKVIDFGLAKVLGAEILDPRSAVKPGDTGGTARYMAPEQVRGDAGDIGPWTDVHALGLITFELLADRLPYNVDNMPAEVMRERIQGARRARLTEVVKGADGELSGILERATAAGIAERTASAKVLGDELEAWLEKRRARTRARAKVRRVVGRKRAVVLAGVACAAMVVAEVVGGGGASAEPQRGVRGEAGADGPGVGGPAVRGCGGGGD
ncbi:MAG: serine/threonine-protein kinase [Phycisphaerales bacterium]